MEQLLQFLAQALQQDQEDYRTCGWLLQRVPGGMNGITYRATHDLDFPQPITLKIRKRDERNRAWREFSALEVLSAQDKPIVPKPIALFSKVDSLPGDVVISNWVEGQVLKNLDDASLPLWDSILTTFFRIHSVSYQDAPHLTKAVLPIQSAVDLIDEIERRYARLSDGALGEISKRDIGLLFQDFKKGPFLNDTPAAKTGLITCDTNPTNMILNSGRVWIIDWESSGWGDPAFDVADLLVRPNCMGVPQEMRTWVLARYAELMHDESLPERILMYERLMLIFWLVLTSSGFSSSNKSERLSGTRSLTLDATKHQQLEYLRRIESVRHL